VKVPRAGEMRNVSKILVGTPELKRLLQIPRLRQEDNKKTDIKEKVRKVWTGLIWHRKGSVNLM
jgi:hypothetical protein